MKYYTKYVVEVKPQQSQLFSVKHYFSAQVPKKAMRNASILTKRVSIQNFRKREIQATGPEDKNTQTMLTNQTYFIGGFSLLRSSPSEKR